jgi:uncharacterized protein YecE (DUF72 family)
MDSLHRFYSGTSGLNLHVGKIDYPPEFHGKSRLEYYASLFNSLEVNSIFYKLPRPATIANWAQVVPDDFRFTFKLSKTITHVKDLAFATKDINDFIATVNFAGNKRGCLLVQFPPSLKVDKLDRLQVLLEALGEATQHNEWRIAMEFRNSSWYEREVYELLEEYNISLVIHDIPASATPMNTLIGEFIYLRLHGPEARYRGSYSNYVLEQYAERIKEWMKDRKTVYAYFNNTAGDAVRNLMTLNEFMK